MLTQKIKEDMNDLRLNAFRVRKMSISFISADKYLFYLWKENLECQKILLSFGRRILL